MLVLAEAYSKAKSQEAFYTLIKEAGLEVYFRGNRPGIKGKRKYRLQNLGYSLERLQALDLQKNKREQELQRIVGKRKAQNRNNERNR